MVRELITHGSKSGGLHNQLPLSYIENQLHWVLHVVFREDENCMSYTIGSYHIALVNRMTLVLLKYNPLRESIAGKRNLASWNANFRMKLLFV